MISHYNTNDLKLSSKITTSDKLHKIKPKLVDNRNIYWQPITHFVNHKVLWTNSFVHRSLSVNSLTKSCDISIIPLGTIWYWETLHHTTSIEIFIQPDWSYDWFRKFILSSIEALTLLSIREKHKIKLTISKKFHSYLDEWFECTSSYIINHIIGLCVNFQGNN